MESEANPSVVEQLPLEQEAAPEVKNELPLENGPNTWPVVMHMGFDEPAKLFVFTYLKGNEAVFQVKMGPAEFEALTNDMLRIVKDYNLRQAQEYEAILPTKTENVPVEEIQEGQSNE